MPRTVLVTGGAGFIGSHLVDALIAKDYQVVVLDNLSTGNKANVHPRAHFIQADITDASFTRALKSYTFDLLFHCAASVSARESFVNPSRDAMNNIIGSLNLLSYALSQKITKFVFASSGGLLYGDGTPRPTPETAATHPSSPYAIGKATFEQYLRLYGEVDGLPWISLRLANVYGERQNGNGEAGVVAIFLKKLLTGSRPLIHGDGNHTRDFIYVHDVVEAFLKAAESHVSGVFHVSTGVETSINALYQLICETGDFGQNPVFGPEKNGEQNRSALDAASAKKDLGWEPQTVLADGLKHTITWFKKNS